MLELLKEYSDIINLLLVALVLPLLNSMRTSRNKERLHNEFIMVSIEKSTKAIEQLRRDMLDSQRRHERIEDAVLFIADDTKVKDVIAILRGFKTTSYRASDYRSGDRFDSHTNHTQRANKKDASA